MITTLLPSINIANKGEILEKIQSWLLNYVTPLYCCELCFVVYISAAPIFHMFVKYWIVSCLKLENSKACISVRSEVFNETSFDDWVDLAVAPAIPASLRLYEELIGLGFQIVLLTGRSENQRNVTETNLLFAGYHSWERLILRYIYFLYLY